MTDRHIMLDLETMGTTPGSAIVSIGAVHFDPAGPDLPKVEFMDFRHRFYVSVSLASCTAKGLSIDADTVEWWLKQAPEARAALSEAGPVSITAALTMLNSFAQNFCGWDDRVIVWGHGASFDPPLIEAAYRACGITPPWTYKAIRDTRTLIALVPGVFVANDHHALHDAWNQAVAVQQCMKFIPVGRGLAHG